MKDSDIPLGITYDDILLLPGYSEILPTEIDTRSRATRRIELNIPILSAAMDTVTEARLAIALAREGGIGVIHKNLSREEQAREVDKVKRSANGVIVDPVTLPPDGASRRGARAHGARTTSRGLPIVERPHGVVGILTNRDLRFQRDDNHARQGRDDEATSSSSPRRAARRSRRRRSSCTSTGSRSCSSSTRDGELAGLITIKDIDMLAEASRRVQGRARAAARRRGGRASTTTSAPSRCSRPAST